MERRGWLVHLGRRYHLRIVATATVVAVVQILAGCTVSLYAKKADGSPAATQAYRTVWARDWTGLGRVSTPWNTAKGKPGVCDIGGSRLGCYQTDQAVLSGLDALVADLRSVEVPAAYASAHRAMLAALNTEISGLQDRDLGLSGRGHPAAFTRGIAELRQAATALITAYTTYPSENRPTPALFGAGRHVS